MQWMKPEMKDVSLMMEVTAYVNTDDPKPGGEKGRVRGETRGRAAGDKPAKAPR